MKTEINKRELFTRTDYINKKCTQAEYYGQFVTTGVMALTGQYFSRAQLVEAVKSDEHLNTIPLSKWDALGRVFMNNSLGLSDLMKERGDFITQAALVCIGKAAAKKIVMELTKNS